MDREQQRKEISSCPYYEDILLEIHDESGFDPYEEEDDNETK